MIFVIGIDHRSAPLVIREDLYKRRADIMHFWKNVFPRDGSVLTTCNRIEIYGDCKDEEEFIYYVPNTFTPDGDKFNNEFKPVFHSGYDSQNYTMYIFDRWGELVFETHDINEGWKGLYGTNGVIAQDGVYTWKIECKHRLTDDIEIAMGSLNLLR